MNHHILSLGINILRDNKRQHYTVHKMTKRNKKATLVTSPRPFWKSTRTKCVHYTLLSPMFAAIHDNFMCTSPNLKYLLMEYSRSR
jgi:hypothetical protein